MPKPSRRGRALPGTRHNMDRVTAAVLGHPEKVAIKSSSTRNAHESGQLSFRGDQRGTRIWRRMGSLLLPWVVKKKMPPTSTAAPTAPQTQGER